VTEAVQYQLEGEVAVISMDDGKANALSHEILAALDEALDRAEQEAKAVVLAGRPGRFSAGFDLKTMTSSPENARALLKRGGEVYMRLFALPMPLVIACTGHALAGGCLTLLCGDVRIGVEGPFKLGMNEVAIGMPLPILAVELVRARVRPQQLDEATLFARIYSPEEACAAGMLTDVVDGESLMPAAMRQAQELAKLNTHAYAESKARLRGRTVDYILDTLDSDLATFGAIG